VEKKSRTLAENRKARHDYFIEETYEAGIALFGTEVKSIRLGQCNLKESFCTVTEGELFIRGMHVSPYEKGNVFNREPLRPRKLLMHKREINRLYGRVKQEGFALVPLRVYLKGPHVKLEIALCKGKKLYDKRADAASRDANREMQKHIKERNQ
jgi:SsrA-binding protein